MKAPVYEHRFAEKSIVFTRYKTELTEALSLHIAAGVDAANKKLDDQKQQMDRMEGKIDDIVQHFRRLDTEQEQDARRVVDEAGGVQKCLESDEHLKKLMNAYGMSSPKALSDLKRTLQKEYEEDLDEALKMHMQQFERKLAAQQQELMNAIKATEKAILTALQSGAHERIKDSDLSTIWKEMNWKGSVKARHFVLALHDHFNERPRVITSHRSSAGLNFLNENEWPLSYININHVQPILEAFDDDGTGFVTIKEVNTFAESRPDDWTLPHWIAYWAAGWHASVEKYKNYIYRLIQDMIKASRAALPENRQALDQYLSDQTFGRIELLLRSTRSLNHPISADRCLSQATEAYTRLEEERLEEALSRMAYEIDTPEVVSLITGPGRIERFIFPLLYLLMKRHIAVITMTKEHVLHSEEFGAMTTTLASIFEVLDDRIDGLASLFRQAHTDVTGRFRNFAFGMMELSYDSASVRDPKRNTLCTWQPSRKFILPSVDLGKPELKYEIESKRRNHANALLVMDVIKRFAERGTCVSTACRKTSRITSISARSVVREWFQKGLCTLGESFDAED
ncbi:hypothetical protein VNI00_000413 [Paramarasmius palmivorus]|uniref:EF-hand domain-containing protein n=1 Tax=Paramarasmius palmivorus TaxID=297713 RepID=A0AAW0ECV9_9AGAR